MQMELGEYGMNPYLLRLVAGLIIFASSNSLSQTCADLNGAYVVAQDTNNTYLGFFGNQFASESINNTFGSYGSQFSSTSVRNSFSNYGSQFSTLSANNDFASSPPIIFKGLNAIAYLTTNFLKSPGLSLELIDGACSFTATSPVTGPVVNTPATWLTASFTGVLAAGEVIALGAPVLDANGITAVNMGVFGVTIRNSDGSVYDFLTINANPNYPTAVALLFISNTYEGKQITFSFSFYDDFGFLEAGPSSSIGVVPLSNNAPIITSSPNTNVNEDELYNYNIFASDPDGDNLTITLTAPSWLTINENTISGTPTNDDVGSSEVTFTISDPDGLSDTQTYTLNVANTNDNAEFNQELLPACGFSTSDNTLDDQIILYPGDEIDCAVAVRENNNPIAYLFTDDDGIEESLNNGDLEFFTYTSEEGYIQIIENNILRTKPDNDDPLTIGWIESLVISEDMSNKDLYVRFRFNDDFNNEEISPRYFLASVGLMQDVNVPAMGGIGLLALGLSMLGLGSVRLRRQ